MIDPTYQPDQQHDNMWLRKRVARHMSELFRLGWPILVSRAAVIALSLADAIMVGHFAARELAYLGIAQAPVMPLLLVLIGLAQGTLIMTAQSLGRGDNMECGRIWRRAVVYGFFIGIVMGAICGAGEFFLNLFGQTPELATNGGRVTAILGLGLPFFIVSVVSSFFLEGIKRPIPAMVGLLIANVLNIWLNWMLIFGNVIYPSH